MGIEGRSSGLSQATFLQGFRMPLPLNSLLQEGLVVSRPTLSRALKSIALPEDEK